MIELPDLKHIKALRKKLGWSQAELAKIANVSQSMINKIENGVKMPSYDTANAIFKAFSAELVAQQDREKKARDIATPDPISILPDQSVGDAIRNLGDRFDQMPVIVDDKCIGSITSKIIISLLSKGGFREMKVRDVMAEPFPVISENEPVRVVEKMLEVFDAVLTSGQGKITGILTRSNLLKS